jgi:hypothetical protein
MSERYLSYNPDRRAVWTEHPVFPKASIKYREERRKRLPGWTHELRIYRIHPGGDTITEIPEAEWDEYTA